jgi:hypothetical protein
LIDEALEVPYVLQLGVNRSPSTQGGAMLKLEAVKDLRKVVTRIRKTDRSEVNPDRAPIADVKSNASHA